MIDIVYYNPKLRVYRNGTVERLFTEQSKLGKGWKEMKYKPDANGYLKIGINSKSTYVHRIIAHCFLGLNEIDNFEIDHINHIENDNRVENLRITTVSENQQNPRKISKGCYYEKNKKKWHARIRDNKKCIFLGLYDTEKEAHQAYLNAKQKYHNLTI
jgi:hypothetical protein